MNERIIIQKLKSLLSESDNPEDRKRDSQSVLFFIQRIFTSKVTGAVFMYFLVHGATTAWLLQVNLRIPEASVYRALKRLRALGIVTPEMRIPKQRHSQGGPRTVVWSLIDSHIDDVARAVRDHEKARAKLFFAST